MLIPDIIIESDTFADTHHTALSLADEHINAPNLASHRKDEHPTKAPVSTALKYLIVQINSNLAG